MQFREVLLSTEKDAKVNAVSHASIITKKRSGKFKLSEAQFIEIASTIWIQAEFSACERLLRCIEIDDELKKEEIAGELHLLLLDNFRLLKDRMGIKTQLSLEDFLPDGKYSTGKVKESLMRGITNENSLQG